MENTIVPAVVMFFCYGIMALVAVQPRSGIGVRSPRLESLSSSGLLASLARALGISNLSRSGLAVLSYVLLAALFLCYLWAVLLVWKKEKRISRPLIYGFFISFSLWLLFLPPLLSQDTFSYIFYGKSLAIHGENPLVAVPASFPKDPIYRFVDWKTQTSVYGPLSNYIGALLILISGKGIAANVIAFKLANFVFLVGSLVVMDRLAGVLLGDRGRLALLIVAWNPLVILHLSGSVHHDTIMVFFMLLGLYLYRKDHPVLGISSVMVASMVKIIALFALVPMLVLFLRENARRPFRQYWESAACIVAIPLALYLPLWSGLGTNIRTIKDMGDRFSVNSGPDFIERTIRGLARLFGGTVSQSSTEMIIGVLFMGVFVVAFIYLCYTVRDFRSLIFACGAIALVHTLTAPYVMPWYLTWALFLIPLSDSALWTGTTIAASFCLSLDLRLVNSRISYYSAIPLLLTGIGLAAGLLLQRQKRQEASEARAAPQQT